MKFGGKVVSGGKTFVRITNREIYDEIKSIKEHQTEHFTLIEKRLDISNGKVKLSRWIATTALSLSLIVLGFFVQHITKN